MDGESGNQGNKSTIPHNGSDMSSVPENTLTEQNIIPLRDEYENAKERLDQQVQTFRTFANEGQSMLRITLIFIGLILTALTALGPDVANQLFGSGNCAVNIPSRSCLSINIVTLVSGLLLGFSALAHGMVSGNEARAVAGKAEISDIQSAQTIQSEEEYLRERLNRYETRIVQNDRYLRFLEQVLAFGKIFMISSIVGLIAVAKAVTTGPIPSSITVTVVLLVLTVSVIIIRFLPDAVIKEDRLFYSPSISGDDE
jgi:hypothetical protein